MLLSVILCGLLKARDPSSQHLRVELGASGSALAGPAVDFERVEHPRFENVINVVVHAELHHVEFFEHMERGGRLRNFWGTVFVSPRFPVDLSKHAVVDCPADRNSKSHDISYGCVAQFLRDFVTASKRRHAADESFLHCHCLACCSLRKNTAWATLLDRHPEQDVSKIKGAIVHHADFWIKPSFGEGFSLENIAWSANIQCQTKRKPDRWVWTNQFNKGLQAMLSRVNRTIKYSVGSVEYCNGNSDVYYLARDVWPIFSTLILEAWSPQKDMGEDYIINEIVIPHTMIAMQRAGHRYSSICMSGNEDYGNLNHWRGKSSSCCWGDASANAGSRLDIYQDFSCGHRADMQLPAVKRTLLQPWHGELEEMTTISDGVGSVEDTTSHEVPATYGKCTCHYFCGCR